MSDEPVSEDSEKPKAEAKAEKPARPARKEPETPTAPVMLDERGEALSGVLPKVFSDFEIEYSAAMDEVVAIVKPKDIPEVCRIAKEDERLNFDYLRSISVVDYEERLEVNYHLFSLENRHKMVIKTSVSPDDPHVPTATGVWRGADWHEREGHDLFGVVFDDHPNLKPLVLYEGFEGFPGRKSFPFHEYEEW
ncbi:MAG: NADH-quinone oxidoreductase subunit C [Chloroflexi bacterium]|nr:NADH-quinone oxidoreductase subunit C [Chloroflexota bacterium]